ncbi:SDR family NAD(P)-dependent oxidoreductase [Nocardia terpenica]|nr:SDR family NAD(P)-dependent oxidoreductase [Nocardia terpenica]MBF6063470.1 SDR family NAD(P)-dependent oxidoreductase [Nocardia terpenica]MBF6106026.1 SDR family NAD(P)-dependent oxidoreductase [Nocardia terpenica]MBF6113389.1 SDR family NAD(P)-dependent oxidoreductase [Nocardia terpenica]MBF6119767.1 SDR family NAD(P)-dependent oxidoreductase [Nocardia terpenica]MBF6152178.1 SDR family NAD(P)-dependent oxidoreductase [Nocardia terpenica]
MTRTFQLSGSKVLLTGATGGLGHAIARSLKECGAELVLTGRRVDVLERLASELKARSIVADLGAADDLTKLLDVAGPVDVLIANAGLPAGGHVLDFNVAELDEAIAVNLRAPIMLARGVAESMRARRRGRIVFMGSIGGRVPSGDTTVYNATKFGLRGFALSMRQDLHRSGVGVSLVEPGFVREAGMFADSGARLPPWFRTVSPEQVAAAVVRATRDDVAEIVVAPFDLRLGVTLGTLAPALASRLQPLLGVRLDPPKT